MKLSAIGILIVWGLIICMALYGFGFQSIEHGLDPSINGEVTSDLVLNWLILVGPPSLSLALFYFDRRSARNSRLS